jgi:hypothetical protein
VEYRRLAIQRAYDRFAAAEDNDLDDSRLGGLGLSVAKVAACGRGSRRHAACVRRSGSVDPVALSATAFISLVRDHATLAEEPRDQVPVRSPDPDDDYLLALAISRRAFLVTGDQHPPLPPRRRNRFSRQPSSSPGFAKTSEASAEPPATLAASPIGSRDRRCGSEAKRHRDDGRALLLLGHLSPSG